MFVVLSRTKQPPHLRGKTGEKVSVNDNGEDLIRLILIVITEIKMQARSTVLPEIM